MSPIVPRSTRGPRVGKLGPPHQHGPWPAPRTRAGQGMPGGRPWTWAWAWTWEARRAFHSLPGAASLPLPISPCILGCHCRFFAPFTTLLSRHSFHDAPFDLRPVAPFSVSITIDFSTTVCVGTHCLSASELAQLLRSLTEYLLTTLVHRNRSPLSSARDTLLARRAWTLI